MALANEQVTCATIMIDLQRSREATLSLRPRCRFPLTLLRLPASAWMLWQRSLDAVAAIESGRAPGSDWRGRANELLDRQVAAEKASESIIQVITMEQPPADLLIRITSGIRTLVEAAVSLRP
jgi:hypothetical protein